MPLVVADTSCLIALERINWLDLLPAVFAQIAAPPVAVEEFGRRPAWLHVIEVNDQSLAESLRTQLDPGEAGAIALAQEQQNAVLLVDEKKARRLARQLGLRLIGTVGVLLRAKRQGDLPAVKPLLDALVGASFRISTGLYNEVLRLAGEQE